MIPPPWVSGRSWRRYFFREKTLDEEHDDGEPDHDAADGCREAVIARYFSHELVVNKDGECLVSLADEHGRAEVSKDTHENKHGAGKERGHDKRHDDFPNAPHAAAPQAFRRFIQRVVQIFQRSRYVNVNEGNDWSVKTRTMPAKPYTPP